MNTYSTKRTIRSSCSAAPVLILSTLLLLLAGPLSSPANAFRPLALQSRSSPTATATTTTIWVSNHGREEDDSSSSSSSSSRMMSFDNSDSSSLDESSSPVKKKKTPQELSNEALWKQFKDINNKFWDYTCNFLYVAIAGLILLNVSGFGYTISREDGLNIMPMQTYRQERQWREELERQQQQQMRQQQQQVVSPASVIQRAPAAFLLQQQQK
mmetsp:Transcript_76649/g.215094  ORF Transcript_76649/g.215094 Transcript_76649/m.215094 type:complete len:213 (+) Transcript_76649:77-715(+)